MQYAAFDLEIIKEIPEGADWRDHAPLGISCAALWTGRPWDSSFWWDSWYGGEALEYHVATDIVGQLGQPPPVYGLKIPDNWRVVTWNGLGFDFPVLAQESSAATACAGLALDHVDLMFAVVCSQGHYLALDTALAGMGLEPKKHEVTLKDGTQLAEMSGAMAPQLWAAGEYGAVLSYLHRDVEGLLELALAVEREGELRWTSRSGRSRAIPMPSPLPTVAECLAWPLPDTSWMADPPSRQQFIEWIPAEMRPEIATEAADTQREDEDDAPSAPFPGYSG